MSEDNVARVVGAVYFAVLHGLDRASATATNDYLRTISRSPHMGPDEKRFLAFLAETANRPEKQDESPWFEVILGGLSS
jgi:hypothetical protein